MPQLLAHNKMHSIRLISFCVHLLLATSLTHAQQATKALTGNDSPTAFPPHTHDNHTHWFDAVEVYLSYSVGILLISIILIRIYSLRLKRRNLELERLVQDRTIELEKQNLELTKANSVKQNFLASISHEIRNPLNGILGIAQLLKDKPSKDIAEKERIDHLQSCTSHLHQLLGQMLDYTSLEAGALQARTVAFDGSTIIHDVVKRHTEVALRKNLKIKVNLPKLSHHWIGDPTLLKQVLSNLLSNSVKYTDKGWVRIQLSTENRASLSHARFIIEDTGTTIAKSEQKNIFKDFTHLNAPGESESSGTRRGLAIAKQLTELMNGTLHLDSGTEQGARLILEIPFTVGEPLSHTQQQRSKHSQPRLLNKSALVADDMDFNRYISKELLTKMGAIVDEAADGEEALKRLKEHDYSLAVLDLNMPKKNGIEVITEYLADNPKTRPTFIALSAYLTMDTEAACLENGFDHFIEKPLDQAKLASLLNDASNAEKAKAGKPATQNLLSYLANNDPQAADALKKRYQAAFLKELQLLKNAIAAHEETRRRTALHKLTGLSNLRREKQVAIWLDRLSSEQATMPSSQQLDICDQVATHIECL